MVFLSFTLIFFSFLFLCFRFRLWGHGLILEASKIESWQKHTPVPIKHSPLCLRLYLGHLGVPSISCYGLFYWHSYLVLAWGVLTFWVTSVCFPFGLCMLIRMAKHNASAYSKEARAKTKPCISSLRPAMKRSVFALSFQYWQFLE